MPLKDKVKACCQKLKSYSKQTRLTQNDPDSRRKGDCNHPADGSDIAYIDVCVLDKEGILNPADEKKVSVEVEGPGYLAGFGSASPCNEENYYDTSAMTFEGRIRAAIRACGAGIIKVTFRSESMETCVEIEAV